MRSLKNLFGLTILLAAGCAASEAHVVSRGALGPAPSQESEPEAQPVPGVVTGTVTYEGEPPEPREVELPERFHGADVPDPILDETWIVSKEGHLANAVVTLEPRRVTPKLSAPPVKGAELVKRVDRFVPRVLVVTRGTEITLKNESRCNCLSFVSRKNKLPENAVKPGELITHVLKKAEWIRVESDLEPWLSGTLVVVDSPFYGVTGKDGAFRFDGVPPGEYTLEVRHETGANQTRRVTVEAGKELSLNLALKP